MLFTSIDSSYSIYKIRSLENEYFLRDVSYFMPECVRIKYEISLIQYSVFGELSLII